MKLVSKIKEFFSKYKEPRHRDRRAWYASDLMKNMRDLYWGAIGETETNPTDLKGQFRMLLGKIIEEGFVGHVLSNLHFFGIHVLGGEKQVPIGGSDPNVDGYLDKLLVERQGDKFSKPWVLEIKTKYGYGADLFKRELDPGASYLAQLGYYLRDLNKKGITNQGMFLFILVSDGSFGEIVQILCKYNEATDEIIAYEAEVMLDGIAREVDFRLKLGPVIERLKKVEEYVKSRTLPPAEQVYKYPITIEYVDSLTDAKIRDALDGKKVHGDWEISYSRYKNKHVELEGGQLGYSTQELKIFEEIYLARHPRSKKRAS